MHIETSDILALTTTLLIILLALFLSQCLLVIPLLLTLYHQNHTGGHRTNSDHHTTPPKPNLQDTHHEKDNNAPASHPPPGETLQNTHQKKDNDAPASHSFPGDTPHKAPQLLPPWMDEPRPFKSLSHIQFNLDTINNTLNSEFRQLNNNITCMMQHFQTHIPQPKALERTEQFPCRTEQFPYRTEQFPYYRRPAPRARTRGYPYENPPRGMPMGAGARARQRTRAAMPDMRDTADMEDWHMEDWPRQRPLNRNTNSHSRPPSPPPNFITDLAFPGPPNNLRREQEDMEDHTTFPAPPAPEFPNPNSQRHQPPPPHAQADSSSQSSQNSSLSDTPPQRAAHDEEIAGVAEAGGQSEGHWSRRASLRDANFPPGLQSSDRGQGGRRRPAPPMGSGDMRNRRNQRTTSRRDRGMRRREDSEDEEEMSYGGYETR